MCEACGFQNLTSTSSVLHEAETIANVGQVVGYTAPNPLPTFTTGQIVEALRTSWLGPRDANNDFPMDTTTRWWYDTTFGNAIEYKLVTNTTLDNGNGTTTNIGSMSAHEAQRISDAFEAWDEVIQDEIQQSADAAIEVYFVTGGSGTSPNGNMGDTSAAGFARTLHDPRNVNNIYGTGDRLIYDVNLNLGRAVDGTSMDGLNGAMQNDGGVADFANGARGYYILLHEIGHALGLSHPGFYNNPTPTPATGVRFAQDNPQTSIMSYFGLDGVTANWRGLNASTPQAHDILAVQTIYGADTQTRLGDTIYGFGNSTGNALYNFSTTQGSVFTIWDAGGNNDTLDASGFTVGGTITLVPGTYSSLGWNNSAQANNNGAMVGNIGIAFNTIIETAIGTAFVDTITGNDAANILRGGLGGDIINGGAGNDTIYHEGIGAGLNTSNDVDTLNGGGGDDTIYGDDQDYLRGEAGGDNIHLLGEWSNEYIAENFTKGWVSGGNSFNSFGADIDTLWLGSINRGVIEVIAGTGRTVNILDGGFEAAHGTAGADVLGGRTLPPFAIELNPLDYSLYGEGGNDTLIGNGARNYFDGGTGLDLLNGYGGNDDLAGGDGNDELRGGTGIDRLQGNGGDDVVYMDRDDQDPTAIWAYVNGGAGFDKVFIEGSVGVTLDLAASEFEEATGGAGDDDLNASGLSIDVTLRGNGGSDTLTGGIGNDLLIDDGSGATYIGGLGRDTVSFAWFQGGMDVNFDGIDVGYGTAVGIDGPTATDSFLEVENIIGGSGDDIVQGGTLNVWNDFYGETGNDTLDGGAGNDRLFGGDGDDTLIGGVGEDTFVGGLGTDSFSGGNDYDTVDYSAITTSINVQMTADGSGSATGTGIGSDTWTSIALVMLGSGNDLAFTSNGSETVDMGGGDDILFASAGVDLYIGGNGSDTLDYTSFTTSITFTESLVTTALGEQDYISEIENVFGSMGNDVITGSSGANILSGYLGTDTINAGAGNDTLVISGGSYLNSRDDLNGGADIDTLDLTNLLQGSWVNLIYGGDEVWARNGAAWQALANMVGVENINGSLYADQFFGDNYANTFSGNDGADMMYGRGGADFLTGGLGSDSLYGEAGTDILTADAGNDYLNGGSEDDVFYLSVTVGNGLDTLDGGAGSFDTINCSNFTDIAWVDLASVGYEVYTKNAGAWQGLANSSNIEVVIGSNQNDELYGDANNNQLFGLFGNDKLEGRSGVDTLNGGSGNDTINGGDQADFLYGEGGNDTFIFGSGFTGIDNADGGADTDTLDCSAFTTLAWVDLAYAGAEVQTFNGAWKAIANVNSIENVIGSGVADELYGNAEDNVLNGGAGSDIIRGRDGSDTLIGGSGSDIFKFALGDTSFGAIDTITDYAKGVVGTGDKIDFVPALIVGGSTTAATATRAQINATTGVVTFAAGSGTTLADALNDIEASFTAGGNAAGEFALFRVNNAGPTYMIVSDGFATFANPDVLIQLTGVTSVGSINLTGGDLTILT